MLTILHKKKIIAALIIPLLFLLMAGFYDQLPDDEISYRTDPTHKGSILKSSLLKIKLAVAAVYHHHIFCLDYINNFRNVFYRLPINPSSFLSSFAYRAPPVRSWPING